MTHLVKDALPVSRLSLVIKALEAAPAQGASSGVARDSIAGLNSTADPLERTLRTVP